MPCRYPANRGKPGQSNVLRAYFSKMSAHDSLFAGAQCLGSLHVLTVFQ